MNEAKVATIFILGAVLGGAGTYWAVTKPIKQKYEGILDAEIQQVKDYYRVIHTKDEYKTPGDRLEAVKEAEEVSEAYESKVSAYAIEQERTTDKSGVEERSIFDYSKPSQATKGETVKESPIRVITFQEFDTEEEDYTKTSLTYYKGDDTVADEMDDIIQDVEATIGLEGLGSFGTNPNDPDTTYIRNDTLRVDYEVLLEEKSYQEIVMGNA